jgi:N-acyl-D-aspartate/D-glutamate deacylase
MKALVRKAMGEGALGLSTGLFYVPGSFAKTEEVIELAKVAAELGGYYDSHMRDEDSYSIGLLGSIQETIRIGREAKIPVNISHIKALGPEVWGKSREAIELIRKARAEGIRVTADQYPYTASGSGLVPSLLPPWAQSGKRAEVLARLTDAANRPRLLEEMERNLVRRGGPESLLFTSAQAPELRGKRLAEVARQRKQKAVEAALDLIVEYMGKEAAGALAVASFNMSEQDVENLMRQDFVMTGSDGSPGHPRRYGTFPRKLREFVYKKKLITLLFTIHQSSAMAAETLHLGQRGLLREGYFADVIAFDPATIADRATYEDPEVLATGIKYVLVNGKIAVENGEYTRILAGRPLRRP